MATRHPSCVLISAGFLCVLLLPQVLSSKCRIGQNPRDFDFRISGHSATNTDNRSTTHIAYTHNVTDDFAHKLCMKYNYQSLYTLLHILLHSLIKDQVDAILDRKTAQDVDWQDFDCARCVTRITDMSRPSPESVQNCRFVLWLNFI